MKLAAPRKKTVKLPAQLPRVPDNAGLLSLDVSSSVIGWAMFAKRNVSSFGAIRSPQSWDSRRRIESNADQLDELISRCCSDDHLLWAVLEWQSHKRSHQCRSAQGLAVLGQSQGYVLRTLRGHLVDYIDLVSERDWTRQGAQNVSKERRARQVRLLCPEYARQVDAGELKDDGLDVADAVGLGFWRLSIR